MKKFECILHWCVFPQNNQNLKGQSEINDSVIFNASSFSFPIQVSFHNYLPVPHTSRVLSSQLHCTYIYLASNVFHYVIIQCLNTNTFWIHRDMPPKWIVWLLDNMWRLVMHRLRNHYKIWVKPEQEVYRLLWKICMKNWLTPEFYKSKRE